MDPAVERYLAALVTRAGEVLGEDLVGVYAAGSVAFGAFEPGRSDVDVALVTGPALTVARKHQLVDRLRHEALPCPARGLELVVYRSAVARSGTAEPGFELELNSGPAMAPRVTLSPADRSPRDGSFWYGLDRSILRQSGLALLGPPAQEVFGELPQRDVHRLLVESLRWWVESAAAGTGEPRQWADAVLAGCRALARHRTGRWLPKMAAARWLLAEDGGPEVVRTAIAARRGGPPPTARRARDFQEQVLAELADGDVQEVL